MRELPEHLVTQPEELAEVCADLRTCERFGFDTEFVGEESYRPHLCLIQIATEDRLVLIDPFTVGPLDAFWQVVLNPAHQVIIHAAREEIRHCHQWAGRGPGNIFDTQIAAGLAGLSYPMGFASLVNQLLSVRLNKGETLTEWRDRPLSPQQIRYAFDDVRFLLPMWHELNDRLTQENRIAWAEEEFARLVRMATNEEPSQEKWRRLKGIGSLDRRQLAVARELYHWRDGVADRTNRPSRTICRDDLLVEVARRRPHRMNDLQNIRGIHKRDVAGIFEAVERARALPTHEYPSAVEREFDPPQVDILASLLSAVLGHLAAEMHLAPNLVATSKDLKLLARTHVARTEMEGSLLCEGWRAKYIRPILEQLLQGEKVIRVVNPRGDAPLHIE